MTLCGLLVVHWKTALQYNPAEISYIMAILQKSSPLQMTPSEKKSIP